MIHRTHVHNAGDGFASAVELSSSRWLAGHLSLPRYALLAVIALIVARTRSFQFQYLTEELALSCYDSHQDTQLPRK